MSSRIACVILTHCPHQEWVRFSQEIAETSSVLDVYIMVDDDTFVPPIIPGVTFLHLDRQIPTEAGYHSCCLEKMPQGTNKCLAWDKAIYHFCEVDTSHSHVWFIEDDVLIPTASYIHTLSEKYRHTDLVCQDNEILSDQPEWVNYALQADKSFPHGRYRSMVCVVMVSQRLLNEIRACVTRLKYIPFIEYMFNTIAMQAGFNVVVPSEFPRILTSLVDKHDLDMRKMYRGVDCGHMIHAVKDSEMHAFVHERMSDSHDTKMVNCDTKKVGYHFITYGTNRYVEHAASIAKSATETGGFDTSRIYTKSDIDERFQQDNRAILSQERGDGYWLWKPYIILKALSELEDGEVLCYSDSMYSFIGDMRQALESWDQSSYTRSDIHITDRKPRDFKFLEREWTKMDAFLLMGVDVNEIVNKNQVWAGFIMLRKSLDSLRFVSEWLTYCRDYRISTDAPSISPNLYTFKENRHDQTVLSLLTHKWSLPLNQWPHEPEVLVATW